MLAFPQPFSFSHLQSSLRRGVLPLQIDDLATVVFHFGGGLGGCLGERVEGGFVGGQEGRPVKVSVSLAFGCMMVFAEIYRVSRLWWAGPSASPTFPARSAFGRPGCTSVLLLLISQGARFQSAQSGSKQRGPATRPADLAGPTRLRQDNRGLDIACSPAAAPLFLARESRQLIVYADPQNSNAPTHKPLRAQTHTCISR